MSFGLADKKVQSICEVFARYPQIERAIIYGSRARGYFKPGSDIDLVLQGKTLNLRIINQISLELDDLFLPYAIDLSIYHHIDNQDFLDHLNRLGVEF